MVGERGGYDANGQAPIGQELGNGAEGIAARAFVEDAVLHYRSPRWGQVRADAAVDFFRWRLSAAPAGIEDVPQCVSDEIERDNGTDKDAPGWNPKPPEALNEREVVG